MNSDAYVELAELRAIAYKCLSICYYLPDQEMLDRLGDLEAALERICPQAAADIAPMRQETDLDKLKIDFSQLFVGPFKLIAPPYGSVYLEGQRTVMGASTIDAERRYQDAGLDIAADLYDAPDHIAIELEFLYFLIFQEIEAIGSGHPQDRGQWLQRQHDFLTRHLGGWVTEFAATAAQGAKTDFYRYLAKATGKFVRADQETVAGITAGP